MDRSTEAVKRIASKYRDQPSRILDVVRDVQTEIGLIDVNIIREIAQEMRVSAMDVTDAAAYYNFLDSRMSITVV